MPNDPEWWRRAVIYQVYPRSFQDSNGDGIGDIQGIIQRLDYLNDGTHQSLGVDAIWLSPTYPSPMKDCGYDVSDYRGVHPDFGTLDDMDRLIAECHKRNIRLLLDWVPNHTSDQHPWFIESRSSRLSAKRDWYVWRDARPDGSLPNNWNSVFRGPAWELDKATGQYYLHSFLKEQPDLNWRNPEVIQAMHDTLRFWFDRGVDGFRIDVIYHTAKHPELADNPPNPTHDPFDPMSPRFLALNSRSDPYVEEIVRGLRRVADEYPGRVFVGEVYGTPREVARYYGGVALDGLHLAFNFNLIVDEAFRPLRWRANAIAEVLRDGLAALPAGAQPCFALGNHDVPRFISRHDRDGRGVERARAAALLLLALPGTSFLYYGEEIGMINRPVPRQARVDPMGRDPERTPMLWDDSPTGGFTAGNPWLPVESAGTSVTSQIDQPDSLLGLYRTAIWTRRGEPALLAGSYEEVLATEEVFCFARRNAAGADLICALNTSSEAVSVPIPPCELILATSSEASGWLSADPANLTLPALAAAWLRTPA
jgi:alpha-glucosidase